MGSLLPGQTVVRQSFRQGCGSGSVVPVAGSNLRKKTPDPTYYLPNTICPRSSDPFHVVTNYIKRVTTSWTHNKIHLFHSA